MVEALLWMLGAPTWAVGGAFTAKAALAQAERHYLQLSREAAEKNHTAPQEVMDADDWIGASIYAAGAFAAFPLVAVGWAVGQVLKPFRRPAEKFFTPPIQKEFNQHVAQLNGQKQLVMGTAKVYREVLDWEPKDHPDRVKLLSDLETQIREQMEDLMRMTTPSRAFDSNFLQDAKGDVKELTAGETWRA